MNRAIHAGRVPRTGVSFADVARLHITSDLPYAGRSASNVLDVYRSRDSAGRQPMLLFVHGGAWDHGDKKSCAPYAVRFALHGYVCVSMNYRLSPEAPYPAAVEDVREAFAWVRDHASDFGGDADRVAVVGQSAGAHLAMLAAYDVPVGQVAPQCVVAFYGPADLTDRAARKMKAVRRFLGARYRAEPELYGDASPLTHVSDESPSTLILQGTVDTLVPVRQAEAVVHALEAAGVEYVYVCVEGWGHAMDRAEPVFAYCVDAMERFFQYHL